MRGYPKVIATKRDIENLLSMSEHVENACKYLKDLSSVDDAFVLVDRGTIENPDVKQVLNLLPNWKRLGFMNRAQFTALSGSHQPKDVIVEEM
jgi:hypothetical protein